MGEIGRDTQYNVAGKYLIFALLLQVPATRAKRFSPCLFVSIERFAGLNDVYFLQPCNFDLSWLKSGNANRETYIMSESHNLLLEYGDERTTDIKFENCFEKKSERHESGNRTAFREIMS